jgi:multisubunit Na+/H+ antiporter MnhC subunit
MAESLVQRALPYSVYLLEVALLALLFLSGRWRRLFGVSLYLLLFFAADAIGRPYVLYRYGVRSATYGYFYWLTDALLALAAFLLVCAFFRRACVREEKMWRFLRLLLVFVFILVLGISLLALSRNYTQLWSYGSLFIVEFGQNLYFTCLVLNTLLYLLMQQLNIADDELGLLVCGIGIQFAGPAASLALLHLMGGNPDADTFTSLVIQACTLAMLLIWLYAIARAPQRATVAALGGEIPAVSEATASSKV